MTAENAPKRKFLLLHVGFTPPTPEIMKAWGAWFSSLQAMQVDAGGFMRGVEVTSEGARDLPWDAGSHTGYNLIEAESLEAAVAVAKRAPFISGVRVFELRSHGR